MNSYRIYQNLARFNGLPSAAAERTLLDCCGSRAWARAVAGSRPFQMLEQLFDTAEQTWFALSAADWLQAFSSHPKIGSNAKGTNQRARSSNWSSGEQAGVESAADAVRERLAEANRLYLEKFGFIFIVCATGKSADEMLAICQARLRNSFESELQIAAEEQRKITEIRLTKLLEQ